MDSGGRVEGRSDKENQLPLVSPQLRDSSAGKRIGYPQSPGTAGSRGSESGDDLYSGFTTGTVGSEESAGSIVRRGVSWQLAVGSWQLAVGSWQENAGQENERFGLDSESQVTVSERLSFGII